MEAEDEDGGEGGDFLRRGLEGEEEDGDDPFKTGEDEGDDMI